MTTAVRTTVDTPVGPAALWTDAADEPRLRLVLGHGAGGGPQAADLEALARALPAEGVTVVRFEQPWRLAGKKVAPRPPVLDEAWLAALGTLPRDVPLVLGGRSSGARVACRTAAELAAAAVVALAFPLHPPGRPAATRLDELVGAAREVPVLVVQGERDSFGGPDEFPAGPHRLVPVAGADHGMRVGKGHSQQEAIGAVVAAVGSFLSSLRPAGGPGHTPS